MDLTAGRTSLKSRGFDYFTDAQCDLCLNDGKNALEDVFEWPWLETTATGTAPLTISDLKHVLYVVDTSNDNILTGLDARDVLDIDEDVTTTGTPEAWWLDGTTTLRVYPVNATPSLSVRYVKFSPELSSGSDTPLIPVRYHPLWIEFAAVEAYRLIGATAQAEAMLADLMNRRVPGMVEVYAVRNRANPSYTVVTGASDDW